MTSSPVLYPDPRLASVAAPVTDFGPALAEVAARLGQALTDIPAIGLAGPHLGINARIVAVRLAASATTVYVNPEIVWRAEATVRHEEGSVSMPGVVAEIERPAAIRLAYRRLDGTAAEADLSGFAAAVLCHEIDQIDGIFFIDRLSRLKRDRLLKRWRKHGA